MSENNTTQMKPKKYTSSLLAILLAAAGWVYGIMNNVVETFKSLFNGSFGSGAALASNSDFAAGGATTSAGATPMLIIAAAVVLLTLLGVAGVVSLFKKMAYNAKCKREAKKNK